MQPAFKLGRRAFLSPSGGDLEPAETPCNPSIKLENQKKIGVRGFSHDVGDILYLSASHFAHPVSSTNLSTLCYTCLSICLRVCMSSCLLGMYEWSDMHTCACVCVCVCMFFLLNFCQSLHTTNPFVILWVTSDPPQHQWVLMTELRILYHPPNKSADLLQPDDWRRERMRRTEDIEVVREDNKQPDRGWKRERVIER